MTDDGNVICLGAVPVAHSVFGQRSMGHKQTAFCLNCGERLHRMPDEDEWRHGLGGRVKVVMEYPPLREV